MDFIEINKGENKLRVSATPVTNRQYEEIFPEHRQLRGKNGFSSGDDEAVIFVSWNEAKDFCKHLSKRENRNFRLPTEAEWEFCCRAGTKTDYFCGESLADEFKREQGNKVNLVKVDLTVGKSSPNSFGFYDMHGLVEEWCEDLYRSPEDDIQNIYGGSRVTRGGSHNIDVKYLKSSSRAAALPDDKNMFTGFRIAEDIEIKKQEYKIIPFVKIPSDKSVPFFAHNHCPSVTVCENGDLLACWFSCNEESSKDMTILCARKKQSEDFWGEPKEFYNIPGRNMTGSALINDNGRIYHFNGVGDGYYWERLCITVRYSDDNGYTWSNPKIINGEHGRGNQVISGAFKLKNGDITFMCDATPHSEGGSVFKVLSTRDFSCLPETLPSKGNYIDSGKGGLIAGIHAGVCELSNGTLLAFGRGDAIGECMPKSISTDKGKTWEYSPSEFAPIGGGQRLVLKKLKDGALFFASFTDDKNLFSDKKNPPKGANLKTPSGEIEKCFGLFCAISYDDGVTWSKKRLISTSEPTKFNGGAWTKDFICDKNHGEPAGYLTAAEDLDGTVHLLSSALHYTLPREWIEE